jgi:hypothetical protein
MTPPVPLEELLTGIKRTRESLPAAMQRDGEAIYRRLLPRHQDAWDELGLSVVWLTAELRRIRDRTLSAVRLAS